MTDQTIYPFNNYVETGLRMTTLLTAANPLIFDVDHLVYFDYMIVHSGDIDPAIPSLHPAVPNRSGEILVRRNLLLLGLEVFIHKGLIKRFYNHSGIQYGTTEYTTPFLDSLEEDYTNSLMLRAQWAVSNFGTYSLAELQALMNRQLSTIRSEFNLEIIR